ncbi:Hsp70-binding protein 1 [Lamellibrachia satsuma]|nr:Hsp70-binding protein 1 [Lamellibrachia satsuma]
MRSIKMAGAGDDEGRGNVPANWKGMLKFCIENTATEDTTSQPTPMDEETKKWLQEVFASVSENDPVKQMAENVQKLQQPCEIEDDVQEHVDLLDETQALCEDIDLANDFHKMGAYSVLDQLLRSDHADIRWRAAQLFATVVQNNPYCQQKALEANLLPLLAQKVDNDVSMLVRVKALYAVSCLVRQFPEGEEAFVSVDGFSVLMRAMQSDEEKLQVKAAFLLANIMLSDPKHKDTLCDMGMIEQLINLLRCEQAAYHEHLVRALVNLVTDHCRSLEECRRSELALYNLLKQLFSDLQGKPEFQEELEHCQELHRLCFDKTPTPAPLDR